MPRPTHGIATDATTGSLPPPAWGRAGVGGHHASHSDASHGSIP